MHIDHSTLHWIGFTLIGLLTLMLIIGAVSYTAKLKASEELWKFALEGAGDGIWDLDLVTGRTKLSHQYKEMFGFNETDTSREIWSKSIHPEDQTSLNEDINNFLISKTDKIVHEYRVICKDKSIKWVLSRGMIVKRDKHGKPLRMLGTHTDITIRKELEARLKNLAHYDSLCNLPNRTLFNDRLKLALSYARREKKMLAVMFIDLDQFKDINDVYGHIVGDNVLKHVAQVLVSCVRESDTVARMGGDEFVILLPIIDEAEDAVLVANKIVEAVNQPIVLNKSNVQDNFADNKLNSVTQMNLHVATSIGIAIYPQHGEDEKLLLINADMAMYQAKRSGKNQAKMFDTGMIK